MSHTRPIDRLPTPPRGAQLRLLRGLLRTPESVLDEIAATVGPVCRLGAGPLRFVVLAEAATVRELLLLPGDRFRWDHPLSPFPFVVGATTMLASSGEDHRRRRGAVQEAFSRRRLDRWIPTIVEQTDDAIDRLLDDASARGTPVDVAVWARRLVILNVVRLLFGERLLGRTAEVEQRFRRIQDFLGSPLWRQAPHPLPIGARGAVRRDRQALDDMIDTEIATARRATVHDPFDILAVLVDRGELNDAEIRDQVKTLIGAGYDTTASSLAWLVWEAMSCDGLWQRLRGEASHVFRNGPEVDLGALELAGRTVRETLRLHPASGIVPRVTRDEVRLATVTIPANTVVAWSPYLTGRDPTCWREPTRFDPDRFEARHDGAPADLSDLAWMPFGRGPRSCIGFGLALMQLTLIIARLAERVDLTPTASELPPAEGLVVSRPRGGVPVVVGRA